MNDMRKLMETLDKIEESEPRPKKDCFSGKVVDHSVTEDDDWVANKNADERYGPANSNAHLSGYEQILDIFSDIDAELDAGGDERYIMSHLDKIRTICQQHT